MQKLFLLAGLVCSTLALPAYADQAAITTDRPFADKPFEAQEIARFDKPWGMAFLPDGRLLVTEKAGRLLLLSSDGRRRSEIAGVPSVNPDGQGALGAIAVDPGFARNGLIYFTYSSAGTPNGIELLRARLEGNRLRDPVVLFKANPLMTGGHYAGRIAFDAQGHLFLSLGERQKFTPAQDPKATLGKVLRLNRDGKPAAGNPLVAQGFDAATWSYGHRNPLGLDFDLEGRLWEVEMGPKGGDEINLVLPGRNYGWPLVSNGDHYDGRPIPDHPTRPDLEAPRVSWNPSISPSDMAIYKGKLFPNWRGKAIISALSGKMIVVVDLGADRSAEVARYTMGERIRAVAEAPDGALYVLEDGKDAKLLRLVPRG